MFDDDFDKLFGGDKPIGMFNQIQKVSAITKMLFVLIFGYITFITMGV